jgi:Fur family peroxide stress response transcriptional regulator
MRNSKQSEIIKADITGRCDHPTAAMVYESVRRMSPNISLGTVYRNLDRLVVGGKIMRISVPRRADRFDVTVKEHYHLVCERCGRTADVESARITRALKRAFVGSSGFVIDEVQLVGLGLCMICEKEEHARIKRQQNRSKLDGGICR